MRRGRPLKRFRESQAAGRAGPAEGADERERVRGLFGLFCAVLAAGVRPLALSVLGERLWTSDGPLVLPEP